MGIIGVNGLKYFAMLWPCRLNMLRKPTKHSSVCANKIYFLHHFVLYWSFESSIRTGHPSIATVKILRLVSKIAKQCCYVAAVHCTHYYDLTRVRATECCDILALFGSLFEETSKCHEICFILYILYSLKVMWINLLN